MRDYYQILRVRDDATAEEIKTSYRRLALRLHPDRNEQANAMDKFLEVQQAYEVLSDPVRKRQYDLKRVIEQSMPDLIEELRRDLLGEKIRMIVSRQQVKAGEPFSVNLRCPKRVDYLKVQGLEHFQIMQSVEHEIWIDGTTVTEAHFVLQAIEEGHFQLGPAKGGAGNVEYTSNVFNINVQGKYKKPPAGLMARMQPVFLWILVIALPAFIVYNVSKYGVKVPEEKYPMLVEGEPRMNRLENGSQPYPNQVDNSLLMSDSAFSQITIQNKRAEDAVFLIVNEPQYKVLRAYYVQAESEVTAGQIPEGKYWLYAFSGDDWEPARWLGQYHLVGGFKYNQHYDEIVEGSFSYYFTQDTVGGQIFYTDYTLELHPTYDNPKPYKLIKDTAFFDL